MIREAAKNDIESIAKFHAKFALDPLRLSDSIYKAEVQRNGFVVYPSFPTIQQLIDEFDTYEKIYLSETSRGIRGVMEIKQVVYFPENAGNVFWFDEQLKHAYFQDQKSICLQYVATLPSSQRGGIARELFQKCVTDLRDLNFHHLFSIVTTGPVTNCPSIIWHTKMGFQRACVTYPISLFGIENYTSLLFYYSLKN